MSNVVKVADYSSKDYWERRFMTEISFEWLQPSSSILQVVEKEILVFLFIIEVTR